MTPLYNLREMEILANRSHVVCSNWRLWAMWIETAEIASGRGSRKFVAWVCGALGCAFRVTIQVSTTYAIFRDSEKVHKIEVNLERSMVSEEAARRPNSMKSAQGNLYKSDCYQTPNIY